MFPPYAVSLHLPMVIILFVVEAVVIIVVEFSRTKVSAPGPGQVAVEETTKMGGGQRRTRDDVVRPMIRADDGARPGRPAGEGGGGCGEEERRRRREHGRHDHQRQSHWLWRRR
jgi:hypothetical protein